jgi:transposase
VTRPGPRRFAWGSLKNKRWCLLKRPANLTDKQNVSLRELLVYNLKSVRAYLLKEEFQLFWDYESPAWAAKHLDAWCIRAMRSRIEPVKHFARTVRPTLRAPRFDEATIKLAGGAAATVIDIEVAR